MKLKAVMKAVPFLEKFIKRLCHFLQDNAMAEVFDQNIMTKDCSMATDNEFDRSRQRNNPVTMQDVFPILER